MITVTLGSLLLVAAVITFVIIGLVAFFSVDDGIAPGRLHLRTFVFGFIAAICVVVIIAVSWFITKGILAP